MKQLEIAHLGVLMTITMEDTRVVGRGVGQPIPRSNAAAQTRAVSQAVEEHLADLARDDVMSSAISIVLALRHRRPASVW